MGEWEHTALTRGPASIYIYIYVQQHTALIILPPTHTRQGIKAPQAVGLSPKNTRPMAQGMPVSRVMTILLLIHSALILRSWTSSPLTGLTVTVNPALKPTSLSKFSPPFQFQEE
jgi:hypothetical protein